MKDKVALVTGAASGIGLATAKAFASRGAAVALMDVDEAALETISDELRAGGSTVLPLTVDVSDYDAVHRSVATVVAELGRLDYAHNNAGVEQPHNPVEDIPEDVFDRVIAVNLKGTFNCMSAELKVMKGAGYGAIVNTSSVGGMVGVRTVSAYNAAKHGVIGLTRAAALESATSGVRVNAVCPGTVETGLVQRRVADNPEFADVYAAMHPMNRLGTAEEIAEGVVWLCSDAASFVTGHAMAIDGGWLAQ